MVRNARRPRWSGPALPVGLVLGLVASGAMVWQASRAAFTDQTFTDNHLGTATVAITNERHGFTLLNVSTLTPGQSAVQCVLVSYTGSATSLVRLYAGAYTDTGGLGNVLTIEVETADTGGYPDNCATFLGNITQIVPAETMDAFALRLDFDDGAPSVNPWTPTGTGQSTAYRITATLPGTAGDALQGKSLDIALIWEAQST